MRGAIERWTESSWVILLVGLLVAGAIGAGLVLAHASVGTSLPTADPREQAGPADQASASAPGATTDFPVGLDPTGAPILLP